MKERTSAQSYKAVLGIRELVFSGEIKPGNRLSEVDLADRLNLSRTPIRGALVKLEQEGLLYHIPSGGYSVKKLRRADIIDAIEQGFSGCP